MHVIRGSTLFLSQRHPKRGKMRRIKGYPQERSLKRSADLVQVALFIAAVNHPERGGGRKGGRATHKMAAPVFLFPPTRHKLTTLRTYKRKGARALSRLYISLRARKGGWSRPSILIGYRGGEGEAVLQGLIPPPYAAPPRNVRATSAILNPPWLFFFSFTPMAFLSFIILFVGTFFYCFSTFTE